MHSPSSKLLACQRSLWMPLTIRKFFCFSLPLIHLEAVTTALLEVLYAHPLGCCTLKSPKIEATLTMVTSFTSSGVLFTIMNSDFFFVYSVVLHNFFFCESLRVFSEAPFDWKFLKVGSVITHRSMT